MSKNIYHRKPIEVEVRGVVYTFRPLDEMLKEFKPNHIVIVFCNKRKKTIEEAWMCDAEIDYDLHGHMENILVSNKQKWFTKDYAVTRVSHIDADCLTFSGPDHKAITMRIMGNILYAVKAH